MFTLFLNENVVTRNGKIDWKHGPNGLFHAFYVENQAILKHIFSIMHENVTKPKSRAVNTVYGPPFINFLCG